MGRFLLSALVVGALLVASLTGPASAGRQLNGTMLANGLGQNGAVLTNGLRNGTTLANGVETGGLSLTGVILPDTN
jgi:hypothetical protein